MGLWAEEHFFSKFRNVSWKSIHSKPVSEILYLSKHFPPRKIVDYRKENMLSTSSPFLSFIIHWEKHVKIFSSFDFFSFCVIFVVSFPFFLLKALSSFFMSAVLFHVRTLFIRPTCAFENYHEKEKEKKEKNAKKF